MLLDSPGDTERKDKLTLFSLKGYDYSKMIFYIISEEKILDSDDMENNNNLQYILFLKMKYKIPLIILLTHSDDYCNKIKNNDKNWKEVCKSQFEKNKNDLLKYLNDTINNKYKLDYTINQDEIKHTVLVEKEKTEITDEDVIKSFDNEDKIDYEEESEEGKKKMIARLKRRMQKEKEKENEVINFINEIGVLGQKQLIEEIKKYLPSQYHSALLSLNN